MKLKQIGEIIRFDTHWETSTGKHAGTIIGYDIGHSKYKVEKHSWDGKPMKGVIEWIFIDGGMVVEKTHSTCPQCKHVFPRMDRYCPQCGFSN